MEMCCGCVAGLDGELEVEYHICWQSSHRCRRLHPMTPHRVCSFRINAHNAGPARFEGGRAIWKKVRHLAATI